MKTIFKPLENDCTVNAILIENEYFPPKVKIEYPALLKMRCYVDECDKEIGWLGLVEKTENNYVIKDVEIMKQNVTDVSVDIKEEGLQEYAERIMARGEYDNLNKIRCWGHSHVNMPVSPSSTDEKTFREYYKECDYFIRIIANKKGDLKLDIAEPLKHIMYTNIKWEVDIPEYIVKKEQEVQSFLEKYNSSLKEIEEMNDKDLSQYKKNAKEEVLKYVNKNSTAWSKSDSKKDNCKIRSYDDLYYSRWDDDYDFSWNDFYSNYYDDDLYDDEEEKDDSTIEMPKIVICRKTESERMEYIDDVFSESDIRLIAASSSIKDIKEICEGEEEFVNYYTKHWKRLWNAAKDFVETFE